MRILSLFLTGLVLTATCGCAYNGSATTVAQPRQVQTQIDASVTVSLSTEQAASVSAHFGGSAGKGRGRNRGLPPGIARNLERGKPLPPGIAKQHLPQDLLVGLPRLDRGLVYLVVAGKLLLVEAATQVVRDILIDAIN